MNSEGAPITQEREPSKLLRNLWELSIEDHEALAKRIESNRGLIRIFVHPFFETAEHYRADSKEAERIQRIDIALQKMAKMEPNKTPPILLFEPYAKINELAAKLTKDSKNEFYTIPTQSHSPQPYFDGDNIGLDQDIHWSKNWSVFIDWLKEMRVKKIILGGQYLIIGSRFGIPSSPKDLEVRGCVGAAGRMLAKDFEVEFSNFAQPETRKEAKEIPFQD